MRITLHIDRLVLHGVAPADAAAVTAGLKAELQRRLALPGANPASADRHRVNAGVVRIAGNRSGDHGGHAMGRAIAGRISREISS